MSKVTLNKLAELWGGGILPPFKPTCWYLKPLDWLFYLARDCSYVATFTADPHLELLKDGAETVGFKVLGFSHLPARLRQRILISTDIDFDDIKGIGDIWILNVEEAWPEIEASQTAFFEELRRRDNRWSGNVLYDPAYPSVRDKHERVMTHFRALNPARLP
jgi:hypothetical protein